MIYLGKKGVLEALLMIPMGLGMCTINASLMFFDPINMVNKTPVDPTKVGTLFLDSTVANNDQLMTLMQVDWLQPIYTLAFSNGLIACLIFIGIGSLLDVGFVMCRPYVSMFLAVCGELGTLLVLPIATLFGMISRKRRPLRWSEAQTVRWFCSVRSKWRRIFSFPSRLWHICIWDWHTADSRIWSSS